MGYVKIFL